MMRNSYAEVPTDSLVPADYNPNILGNADFLALIEEVRGNGHLLKPIVVREMDGHRVIVDGHFNWRAAQEAGLSSVPIEVIEADDFEARRQTLIRNRTGSKDNLKLGRVYRDMLAAPGISNRVLAKMLLVTEGSIRNQLLHPLAWDLLREKGSRLLRPDGEPMSPEAYSGYNGVYTEPLVSRLGIREVRALIAGLQGLTDEDEGADRPGAAEPEARILTRLKRAWNKASEDERRQFIEWTGVLAEVERRVQEARARGFDEGHEMARRAGKAQRESATRNSYADDSRAPCSVTQAKRLQGLCRQAGIDYGEITRELSGGIASSTQVTAVLNGKSKLAGLFEIVQRNLPKVLARLEAQSAPQERAYASTDEEWQAAAKPEARNDYAERGRRIREARKARGLSGKDLAASASVSPQAVYMAETGRLTKSGGPAAGRPVYPKLERVLGLDDAA